MAIAPRTDNPAKDMAAIMAQARNYPDSRLADVLAGKDMSIPQYVAMAEAMGRRNLRQAVDGAQAQQQAQQPSVKEQLLAEQSAPQMVAGIDQLAAPNMESMDLAGGGIIAFSGKDGSYVDANLTEEEKQALRDRTDFLAGGKKLLASAADVVTLPVRGAMGAINTGVIRPIRATGVGLPYIPEEAFGGSSSSMTPYFDRYVRAQEQKDKNAAGIAKVLEKPIGDQPGDYPVLPGQDALKNTSANAAPAGAAVPNSAINLSQPTTFERRASPFGQMSAEKVDVDGLKSRGLGEGLMRLSAGLLSAPGAKGVSAGIAGLAEQAGLTRKETNALKKDARDYDLNLKRAEAAFEQGQDELGLKFTEAANVNRYRMASLNQEPNELRTLKAIAENPQLAAIYKGGKNIESYSLKDATDAFNKLEGSKLRDLKKIGVTTPSEYRQFVITGLPPMQVVDTLGKGDKVRS
jgi:hypothetical protein